MFSNLVKVFINLKELNGKNYQFVINKKMKMISLAKIVGNV